MLLGAAAEDGGDDDAMVRRDRTRDVEAVLADVTRRVRADFFSRRLEPRDEGPIRRYAQDIGLVIWDPITFTPPYSRYFGRSSGETTEKKKATSWPTPSGTKSRMTAFSAT